ncbi:hypothetical protein SCLCIDRAFT_674145 [Scleroderma citrinum Foug A]|uniref:Uncharacterized protein n=1 Tax=Scleroderma citrinum Foug A TaxID=1036808 RepID=A0A0C3E654_9AGAM|nr:hypothetical protein SCLCIDRAFT_674145 [Scleroderma citrinum Foug A]
MTSLTGSRQCIDSMHDRSTRCSDHSRIAGHMIKRNYVLNKSIHRLMSTASWCAATVQIPRTVCASLTKLAFMTPFDRRWSFIFSFFHQYGQLLRVPRHRWSSTKRAVRLLRR